MLNFMALYWGQGFKKKKKKKGIPMNLGSQFATLETNVPAFTIIQMSMF
jgi:hypothetical protein